MWFLLLLLAITACRKNQHAEHVDTYTCPMHPSVISDRPGSCPVCGMDLVRKSRPGEEVKITGELARLVQSPNETVVASIATTRGEYKSLPVKTEAHGIVTYDTRKVYQIPARIGGRLERVFLKYIFQPVAKGQRIADIYSPELLTAQRELLYLTTNDPLNQSLIESARSKLYLLGASENQVAELLLRKEPLYTFPIFSPYSGYVVNSTSLPVMQASSVGTKSTDDGMGGPTLNTTGTSVAANSLPPTELIREGAYVSAGQILFKVANTDALRVELNLPTTLTGTVHMGDPLVLDWGNGVTEKGQIDFVQPFFSEGEEFIKIRVYVSNKGQLRIGQLVTAMIELKETEALWVPREAVIDLGLDKIVFVKERGAFQPRKVVTGILTDGKIEIRKGLSSAEEVAIHAQYLVDSESFIRPR